MGIENHTLVHFRHFSSLLTNELRLRILTYEIIKLFLQNEPNFRKGQVSVTALLRRKYDKMDTWSIGKNEPKTNPNEPNSKKVKMNVSRVLTMDYENIPNWAICENEPNSKPIYRSVAPAEAGFHRSVAPGEAGTNQASKRRKITCFTAGYPYNYRFGINIGDFLCVNNAAVVVLMRKPPSKTR